MHIGNELARYDRGGALAKYVSNRPAPGESNEDAPVNLWKPLYGMLRNRWKWALPLAVIGAVVGAFAALKTVKPTFRTVGYVRIRPTAQRILSQEQNQTIPAFQAFVDAQASVLRSPRVVDLAIRQPEWKALKRGDSQEDADAFAGGLTTKHMKGSELVEVDYVDKTPVASLRGLRSTLAAYTTLYAENDAQSGAQALDILQRHKAQLQDQLDTLNTKIADIGNQFGSTQLEHLFQYKSMEVNQLSQELRKVQLDRMDLEASLGITAASAPRVAETHPGDTAPAAGATTAPSAVARTASAAAAAAVVPPPLAVPPQALVDISAEAMASADNLMRDYIHKQQDAEQTLELMRSQLGENHPQVLRQRAIVRQAQDAVQSRVALLRQIPGLLKDVPNAARLQQLIDEENRVTMFLDRAKADRDELGRKNLLVQSHQSEKNSVQQRLEETSRRIEQLNVEAASTGKMEVLDNGSLPTGPDGNKRLMAIGGGGMGGGMAGLALVLGVALIDRRARSISDARLALGDQVSILGAVPILDRDGPSQEGIQSAANCVHRIRTRLQLQSMEERPVFAITSAAPGNGKTSLTMALGLSFAASNAKTLLIDADVMGAGLTRITGAVVHPKLGKLLENAGIILPQQLDRALGHARQNGVPIGQTLVDMGLVTEQQVDEALTVQDQTGLGLFDVLAGEPLANCVFQAGAQGLHVLPMGGSVSATAARLSPSAIRRLVEEARKQFDAVILDTGPVFGSLEASVVAAEADQVILAMSRGDRQGDSSRAIHELQSVGADIAGIVFNRARFTDVVKSGYSGFSSSSNISRNGNGTGHDVPDGGGRMVRGRATMGPIASAVVEATDTRGGRRQV